MKDRVEIIDKIYQSAAEYESTHFIKAQIVNVHFGA